MLPASSTKASRSDYENDPIKRASDESIDSRQRSYIRVTIISNLN